jgi:2-methylcitrate dehydratase PrpD
MATGIGTRSEDGNNGRSSAIHRGAQYDDLPAAVVAAAKIGILDGIANLLAGSTQPVAQLISAYTLELGGIPVAGVIGHGFKTNPLNAAVANGVFGHGLDCELQGQPSSHGTSSILPGPLALAEAQGGASGKELLVAYALGWDVQQRIVAASHRAGANLRGFHPPGVYGPLGGTASAAKILKLTQEGTVLMGQSFDNRCGTGVLRGS